MRSLTRHISDILNLIVKFVDQFVQSAFIVFISSILQLAISRDFKKLQLSQQAA